MGPVSASVLLVFGREVAVDEWEKIAGEIGLVHQARVFPSNVWRLATADVEVRWGWPTEDEARRRAKPARATGVQVSSYKDADLAENARVVWLLETKLAAFPEIVPMDLLPHLERARAGG